MKRSSLFLIVILLIASLFSMQQLNAQDKNKEEKEKQIVIEKEIEAQKRSMHDQKRAHEEALQRLQ
jgi:hypothetical protein